MSVSSRASKPLSDAAVRRLRAASDAEKQAAAAHARARKKLAGELRRASAKGYTVRELATATRRGPTSTHKLIGGAS